MKDGVTFRAEHRSGFLWQQFRSGVAGGLWEAFTGRTGGAPKPAVEQLASISPGGRHPLYV